MCVNKLRVHKDILNQKLPQMNKQVIFIGEFLLVQGRPQIMSSQYAVFETYALNNANVHVLANAYASILLNYLPKTKVVKTVVYQNR